MALLNSFPFFLYQQIFFETFQPQGQLFSAKEPRGAEVKTNLYPGIRNSLDDSKHKL